MATLPNPNELSRPNAQPLSSVIGANTGGVERALAASARAEGDLSQQAARAEGNRAGRTHDTFGNLLNNAAVAKRNMDAMVEEERKRLDDIKVQEYRNKLVGVGTARRLQAESVKGGNVLKDDFVKSTMTGLDGDNDVLMSELATDEQKAVAKQHYGQFKAQFGRDVAVHAVRETDALEQSTYEGEIASWTGYGVSSPTNADATRAGVEGVRNAVINKMVKEGKAPTDIETEATKAAGGVHLQVVGALKESGNIAYANEYLKTNRRDMSPEQSKAGAAALLQATEYETGITVGNQVYELERAGATPVQARKALDKLSKGERAAAEGAMRDAGVAQRAVDDETIGGIFLSYRNSARTQTDISRVVQSKAFGELSNVDKNNVLSHLEQISKAASRDAEADANDAKAKKEGAPKTLEIMGGFMDDPERLTRMTNAQLGALEPTIGTANTNKLITARKMVIKDANAFKIPPAIVSAAVAAVPKDKQAQVKGAIAQSLMEWKLQNPGAKPTEDQLADITRAGQDTWVNTDTFFNSEAPAYEVPVGKGYPLAFKDNFKKLDDEELTDKYNEYSAFRSRLVSGLRAKGKPIPDEKRMLDFFKKRGTISIPN